MVELRGQIDGPWKRVEMVRAAEELHERWRKMEVQAEYWHKKYQYLKEEMEVEAELWVGEVMEMELEMEEMKEEMEEMKEEWWEEEDRLCAQAEVLALELQSMERREERHAHG